MIRALLHLGRTPLVRRLLAAVILIGGALLATFARQSGQPGWFDLAINLVVALIALFILHLRWRTREKREISPAKARDIFS
jgi:predicted signal transduction protein with EAL and GGDEF domain